MNMDINHLLKSLIQSNINPGAIIQHNGSIVVSNLAFKTALELSPQAPLPRHCSELFPPLVYRQITSLIENQQILPDIYAFARTAQQQQIWEWHIGSLEIPDQSETYYLLSAKTLAPTNDFIDILKNSFQHSHIGLFILDSEEPTKLYYVNRTFQSMLSYEAEDHFFTDYDMSVNIHPHDKEVGYDMLQDIHNGMAFNVTFRILNRDKEYIWIQLQAQPVPLPNGKEYLIGIVSDLSAHKEQEYLLSIKNQELSLYESILKALNSSLDIRAILQEILNSSHQFIDFSSGNVLLLDDRLSGIVAFEGYSETTNIKRLEQIANISVALKQAIHSQRPLVIDDIKEDARWQHFSDNDHIRNWMAIPLVYQGKTLGIIQFEHQLPRQFQVHHVEHASRIAEYATTAIANAHLYEQAQLEIQKRQAAHRNLFETLTKTQRMNIISQMLLDFENQTESVFYEVQQLFNALAVMLVQVYVNKGFKLIGHYSEELNQADLIQLEQKPILLASLMHQESGILTRTMLGDESIYGDIIIVPVLEDIAFLVIGHSEASPYESIDLEQLEMIGNQLSIALRNQQLYDQLQWYTSELQDLIKERTRQLEVERQRLEIIIGGTNEGIVYMEDFHFQLVNPTFCKMMGMEYEQLIGKTLDIIFPKDELAPIVSQQIKSIIDRAVKDGSAWQDIQLQNAEGKRLDVSFSLSILSDIYQSPIKSVAVIQDISQSKKLQQQKSRFISNAAHELRTPLTTLQLRLHMLKAQPDRLESHLDVIERSFLNIKGLVEELVEFTRFDSQSVELRPDMCNLVTLLQDAIDEIAYEKNIGDLTFHFTPPQKAIIVIADRRRISQAIKNILSYMIEGRNMETHDIYIRILANDLRIEIELEDPHSQQDESLLPHEIFQPFSRPNLGDSVSMSLALAIAKQAIELHHGDLKVENISDAGYCFTIMIPRTTVSDESNPLLA